MKKAVVITSAVVGGLLTLGGIAFVILKKSGKLKCIRTKFKPDYDTDSLDSLL